MSFGTSGAGRSSFPLPRRRLRRRAVVLAAAVALLMAVSAPGTRAQERFEFSGLTIVAHGDQEIDLFTGITTLPGGGEVIAAEQGVRITGDRLTFLQGEFVEATGVVAETRFGQARADGLRIDLVSGDITAVGPIGFEHDHLRLTAADLTYLAQPGIVRFRGPVRGEGIEFEAAMLFLDVRSETILLVGPYRYAEGILELNSSREGALLSLRRLESETIDLEASSQVDPELLERIRPHLP